MCQAVDILSADREGGIHALRSAPPFAMHDHYQPCAVLTMYVAAACLAKRLLYTVH